MNDTLETIIREIKKHDEEHPSHGVGCACHDAHAGTIRRLLDKEGLKQNRKSLQNLLTVLGYVMRNP